MLINQYNLMPSGSSRQREFTSLSACSNDDYSLAVHCVVPLFRLPGCLSNSLPPPGDGSWTGAVLLPSS